MADRCRACRADLDHCHGTLIHHPLRTPECTDDGCTGAEPIRHVMVLDCDAVGCGCARPAAAAG